MELIGYIFAYLACVLASIDIVCEIIDIIKKGKRK